MPTIFISYRREDSVASAGRIHDKLVPRFGQKSVFMDVDAIPFGVDFRQHIADAVAKCDVLLALIGEQWLTVSQNGQRRLDDPRDFVRIEIEAALQRGIPVIPVLLGGTAMPTADKLPAALAELSYRNAARVDPGADFHMHMDRLIRGLERLLSKPNDVAADRQEPHATNLRAGGITNSIGMAFTRIEPGTFWMGSPETDGEARADEKPRHRVTISKPFLLGIHPVTRGQFAQFVADQGYRTDAETDGGTLICAGKKAVTDPGINWRRLDFEQEDNHPVAAVSWNDAQAFIDWLTQKDGRPYRLPTEAEWEYACRAGAEARFFSGDDAGSLAGFANVADLANGRQFPGWPTFDFDDGYVYTSPVGTFKPNPWGLFDMTGDVWEWCSDWYDPRAYLRGDCQDPQGPTSGESKVQRGGAWSSEPRKCRSAFRDWYAPTYRSHRSGFRVALTLSA